MRLFRKQILAVLSIVLIGGLYTRAALAQFDEMVKHIPSNANALFMVNAEKVFSSEVAKSENWQAQRGKRFDSGLTSIPPNALQVAVGSLIDLEIMRPTWDAAVVRFQTAPTLADVRQHFGGVDDTIADTPVLRLADDAYIARFSDQELGAFGPGNRQLVTGWLTNSNGQLSPYLLEALRYEDANADVILAIDAANALTPAFVEQRLEMSKDPAITGAKLSPKEIASLVSTLRGIMLGITFGQRPYGKIKIDFGQDATPLAELAKPLVLGALANHGALIDEMEEWKAEVKGNTIYLEGNLGDSGLTRISSLINLPTQGLQVTASQGTAAAQGKPAASPEQTVVATTQNYFKSIEHLLADLKSRKGEERTIGQIGMWFQSYANKVDRLPILNVDDEMLQYGHYVAQQLRNASMAIKGYGINKRVAEENADMNSAPFGGALGQSVNDYYANGGYGRPIGAGAAYGWVRRVGPANAAYWAGRSQMRQAFAARTQADVQLKAVAATSVQQIMEQLREAQEKVRTDMTKKYKVEF